MWSLQFDRFLHAVIETERNGMDLSVLSLLARVGQDPWAEAARLAELPRAAAVDSLAATIAGLPGESQTRSHARAVALYLLPLLPSKVHPAPGTPTAGRHQGSHMSGPMLAGVMLGATLALGLLIGAIARDVAHAGPPSVPEGAMPASKTAPVEHSFWPAPGGPWPMSPDASSGRPGGLSHIPSSAG